jgi:DNA-binding beta-propeller fold protein YncE
MNRFFARPLFAGLLAAAACLLLQSCGETSEWERHVIEFKYQGRIWRAAYFKSVATKQTRPVQILGPDGVELPPSTPQPIILPKDGKFFLPVGATVKPFGGAGRRSAAATGYLYILDTAQQDFVRAFSLTDGSLQASVPLTEDPIGLAISPDGRFVYVSHLGDTQPAVLPPRVSVIDAAAGKVVQTINLPARVTPGIPLMSPDGSILYLPNQGQFATPG